MNAATSFSRSSCLEAREVAERNALAARQQRAEALLEELVADQRQRPERDAVKAAVAGDQPRPAGGGARELHRRVDRLRAGAREEHRVEPRRQPPGELLREHARRAPSSGSARRPPGPPRASPAAPRARPDGCGRGSRSPRRCGSPGTRDRRRRTGRSPSPTRSSLSKPRMLSTSTSDGSRCRVASASVSSARAAASATTPRESPSCAGPGSVIIAEPPVLLSSCPPIPTRRRRPCRTWPRARCWRRRSV